jgi:hypothetical protein
LRSFAKQAPTPNDADASPAAFSIVVADLDRRRSAEHRPAARSVRQRSPVAWRERPNGDPPARWPARATIAASAGLSLALWGALAGLIGLLG